MEAIIKQWFELNAEYEINEEVAYNIFKELQYIDWYDLSTSEKNIIKILYGVYCK